MTKRELIFIHLFPPWKIWLIKWIPSSRDDSFHLSYIMPCWPRFISLRQSYQLLIAMKCRAVRYVLGNVIMLQKLTLEHTKAHWSISGAQRFSSRGLDNPFNAQESCSIYSQTFAVFFIKTMRCLRSRSKVRIYDDKCDFVSCLV